MFLNSLRSGRKLTAAFALTTLFGAGCLLTSLVPALARTADEKDDTAYTVKRVYKAGESDRYKISSKVNMNNPAAGGDVEILTTMLVKETTKEAKDDGSIVSISEFESAGVTFNGMDIDITTMMPKVTTSRDKSGKIDVKTEGGNEQVTSQMGQMMKQMSSLSAVAFPTKAVKVGDSWDIDSSQFGTGIPSAKVKGKVTLVSADMVKGVKVLKFKTVSDVTGDMDTKMHSEATTLVNAATGKPISMTNKTEGDAGGGKISVEMTMKALGPNEKGNEKEAVKAEEVKKP